MLKYASEMEYIMFFKWTIFFHCLLFLDPFLYISYVELVDTEGKKPYQEFSQQNTFIRQKQICYFVFVSPDDLVRKFNFYLSTEQE